MTTTWHGWFGLGGQVKGAPAAVFPAPGLIDVYARGMDDRLWQKWFDGSKWNPGDLDWAQHDDGTFRLGSAPAVVSTGVNDRDVYVRGADGGVYHKFWDGSKWNGWFGLGGEIKGAPAVVCPTPSTIDIYVRGMDDRLWQKWWDGSKWNPSDDGWLPHDDNGFKISGEPAVIASGANFRDVYARGKDGRVYHKWWDGTKWNGWFGLGGPIKEGPSVVQVRPGVFDIYVEGTDGRLWQKWWDGSQWNPSDAGWIMHHDANLRLGSAPAAVSGGDTLRDVYVRHSEGSVLHKFWNNQKHSNAQEIRDDAARSKIIDVAVKAQVSASIPGLAIAVVKNGRIVHLAGYGVANTTTKQPITSETMFHMASCGKQFTGLGIMMLKDSHPNFGYDDHIGKHIPELAGFPAGVTIRRLLHHLSDIQDFYDSDSVNAVLQQSGGQMPFNNHVIKAMAAKGFPMNPDAGGPGDKYVYSNSEYDLLGSVIERVSGQSYPDFFHSRIFRVLGMTDTFSLPQTKRLADANCAKGYDRDPSFKFVENGVNILDNIVGSGSFYASVYDLCAYDYALASNLFVNANSLHTAYTSGVTTGGDVTNYGFGWALGSAGSLQFAEHGGYWMGFISWIRRCTTQPLSIYILSNNTSLDLGMVMNAAMQAYQ